MIGDLPEYGMEWYHPNSVANILSLACMKKHGFFGVQQQWEWSLWSISQMEWLECLSSQIADYTFFLDSADDRHGVAMVNTVDDNKSSYTNCDYSHTCLAH